MLKLTEKVSVPKLILKIWWVKFIKQLLIFYFLIRNVWLGGHSAGAHLAASMIHPKVHKKINIKGFILISGIFDLNPLLETSINDALKLTK